VAAGGQATSRAELIPRCRRQGLGRPPQLTGIMGISMGAAAPCFWPRNTRACLLRWAAISPAVWTSYQEAKDASVRIAAGDDDDPLYPGVQAFARALPAGADVSFGQGCHTGAFFVQQEPPSLAFLARHLVT
jgi:hypothetical protein